MDSRTILQQGNCFNNTIDVQTYYNNTQLNRSNTIATPKNYYNTQPFSNNTWPLSGSDTLPYQD